MKMADLAFTPAISINLTDPSEAYLYTYSYTEAVVITVLNPLVLAVGLLANLGLLFVIARVRRMWTVLNVYLVDLSIAGIIQLIIGVSTALARYRASPVYGDFVSFGPLGCTVVSVLQDITTWSAFSFAVLVTVILHYAVCKPHRFRRFRSKTRAVKVSAGVWCLCTCASLCFLPTWSNFVTYGIAWPDTQHYEDYPWSIGVCSPQAEWLLITHDLILSTAFFVCFINNAAIFTVILRALRKRLRLVRPAQIEPGDSKSRSNTQLKRSRNRLSITRMLAVSSLAFFLLPMPYECTLFARSIAKLTGNYVLDDRQFRDLQFVSITLLNITPAICPYIYVLSNPSYRSAAVEAFTRGCRKKRNNDFVIRGGEMSAIGN